MAVLANCTEEIPRTPGSSTTPFIDNAESEDILTLLVIIVMLVARLGIRRKMKAGHGGGLGALMFGGGSGVLDDDFTYGVWIVSGGGGGVFQWLWWSGWGLPSVWVWVWW